MTVHNPRPSALVSLVLIAGCATSPGGPSRPGDSGSRADGVAAGDVSGPGDGVVPSSDADLGAGDAATPGIALEQLGTAVKQAKCEGMLACGLAPDEAACLAAVTAGWDDLAQLKADVAAGRVAYDPLQAAACVELFRGADCPVVWFDRAAGSAACRAVFRGLVADGGACFDHLSCASGRCLGCDEEGVCRPLVCPEEDPCCARTCVPNPVLGLGDDCSTGRCPAGAICFKDILGPPTCQTLSVEGEDCFEHAHCADGLFCAGAIGTSVPGACQAPAAAGDPCQRSLGAFACARLDHWCDNSDDTCRPRVGVGATCDPTYPSCVGMASCDADAKTCEPLPGPGELCDQSTFWWCLGELTCEGTCQLPEDDPQACP